jgi:hypothetical protein
MSAEIRFHQVRAHVRGADPEEMEILFDGNDANKHREIFEQAAVDSQYDTVALFEHVTPRMVVHPPPPLGPAPKGAAGEVKAPPLAAEAKAPEPETHHKGKPKKY